MSHAEQLDLMTTEECARVLRCRPQTLRKSRWLGRGPSYIRLGNRVLYERAAVISWIRAHTVTAGADETNGRAA